MSGRETRRPGFTLVELLVVVAIIAMFMVAILPAVQSMRTAARRSQCRNQLLQLTMAVQNYEMAQEHFPAGVINPSGPIRSVAEGKHHGWLIAVLPHLDEGVVHRNVDLEASVYAEANARARAHVLDKLVCPAGDASAAEAVSSYAACHHGAEAPIDADNRGVFYLNSRTTREDVRDGLAQTLFLGEKRIEADDLGWMSGTRATLRNTGTPLGRGGGPPPAAAQADDGAEVPEPAAPAAPSALSVGGFGSHHPAGVHLAFGDGRIQFMVRHVDPRVFALLGDRDDGTLLSPEDYRE